MQALAAARFQNISLIDVKGMLSALCQREWEYSVEIGEKVITEMKLESTRSIRDMPLYRVHATESFTTRSRYVA